MDLEKKFKEETGFNAYIDNNLEPRIPLGYYVEWLEEQCTINGVSKSLPKYLQKCNRVEVIDQKGRSYVNWKQTNKVEISLQDDDKTVKIFITG